MNQNECKNEARQYAYEWLINEKPHISKSAFYTIWIAALKNGWKCLVGCYEDHDLFFEITKFYENGEVRITVYRRCGYSVRPNKESTMLNPRDLRSY